MARNVKDKNKGQKPITDDKGFRKQLQTLNNMIGQANLGLYGTDRNGDVDSLNSQFQSIIDAQLNDLTDKDNMDVTSFLGQLVSRDKKITAQNNLFSSKNMSISADDVNAMSAFIMDAYKNRLLEQSDIHEVSSALIELSEAILITRDAIISPDIVEGRMSRDLKFENIAEEESKNYISIVENMEKRFDLLNKIKNFIVPKTLEYGEYFAYTIPYSELFKDFQGQQQDIIDRHGFHFNESVNDYDQTILESFADLSPKKNKKDKYYSEDFHDFAKSTYEEYINESSSDKNSVTEEAFEKDLQNILGNITINNNAIPFPLMEEGIQSFTYMANKHHDVMTEKGNVPKDGNDWFKQVSSGKLKDEGTYIDNSEGDIATNKKVDGNEFSDIVDCYIKLLEPLKVLPLEIMDEPIGYYYVEAEDITPLGGVVSGSLYINKFEQNRRESTVIDAIAERVIKSFNKKFLENNSKFKKLIVECINYYNLNEKRIRFQFIPIEYMQVFKIDVDENNHGQSMIKKSLFYAKLYLMLLLFKIMSIILYSNDQRVNYIKQSGIDKDTANKIQEIARLKQARQINMVDLFSYTTLINKVGNGSEMYVPLGRNGERPMETEILSGQDIQLNSDLLEMLKNAYILGTGVPAALINYLNEADFAKQIEQNNTKFNGRVVNYQLDFNNYITQWYKKIMKWSTNIEENIIDNFLFILQPPKTTAVNTKSEVIGQFQGLADFIVGLFYPDPNESIDPEKDKASIRLFKQRLAEDQLTMLNMARIKEIKTQSDLDAMEERIKPNPANGDNGDDIGLDEEDIADTTGMM